LFNLKLVLIFRSSISQKYYFLALDFGLALVLGFVLDTDFIDLFTAEVNDFQEVCNSPNMALFLFL